MREQPTVLAIFGISGDLSRRYLLPSLAAIKKAGQLPADFKVLGISRRDITPADIYNKQTDCLAEDSKFLKMDMESTADFQRLKDAVSRISGEFQKPTQVIFYLVVPPDAVQTIVSNLGSAGLNGQNTKLLLEKPFGSDLESARSLVKHIAKCFKEEQVYRIDHYLAKGLAQNISTFLGGNALFRSVWNKDFIDYIEIVAAESIGLEGRTNYYEQTGALRDFTQSHLMQLAALTLMEPCANLFNFSEIPVRRLSALRALKWDSANPANSALRGQYNGYREEVGNPDSTTETFAAVKLHSDDPRWQGVPIYLATGKKLDQKLTQIRVNFKRTNDTEANTLVLRIQPRDGIELDLWVKQPGYSKELEKRTLSFSFEQNFDHLPEAYEQVLIDAIRSDHSLFASSEEVLASWETLQPLLDHWRSSADDLRIYQPGSTADEVLRGFNEV